ncbi:RecQ family ATP-dependent DNA helicase [Bacillus sp. AGMB 02131]|uniref:RecQ family ATP-dependent DNA helicase n=1 Tax=Peribacillus faecalis TaxID=2772559 RepID=A0A927D0B1_9BACI|nr:ATP-dependent DNA helicase RecQ [Peribacillus faecalis]MBD3110359.1 RecQ family ATP-dependent DNA helicase [Peribacillus faecalis]
MTLEEALYRYFGYQSFRHGQKETIKAVLDGKDTLAMLATGTGKSICYQLPTYLRKKPTVIVSPLVSLMQDQVEQLKVNGEKRVIALNSFLSVQEKSDVLKALNQYMFIFMSPEMLVLPHVLRELERLDIGLFVVDEAHCISQWGFDFRPDYMHLGEVRKQLNNPVTLALTATATEEVRADIKRFLLLEKCYEIITTVDRSNIGLFIEKHESYADKEARLIDLVKKLQKPGIIYFSSKRTAEHIQAVMRENGIEGTAVYHAGLDVEQRVLIQQQFLRNQLQVICATSAFGMGINKENVRFVIHFHLPSSMESYLQEIGRAGRDGKQSAAILLYSHGDEELPQFLLNSEYLHEDQIESLTEILAQSKTEADEMFMKRMIADGAREIGITETQEKLFRHFMQQKEWSLDRRKALFIKHQQESARKKQIKWQSFYHWVFQKECYRDGIRRYFSETPGKHPALCCSNCHSSLEDCYQKDDSVKEYNEMMARLSWQEELAKFLLPEEEM